MASYVVKPPATAPVVVPHAATLDEDLYYHPHIYEGPPAHVEHPTPTTTPTPTPTPTPAATPAAPHPTSIADLFRVMGHWVEDLGITATSSGITSTHTTPPGSDGTTKTTTVGVGDGGATYSTTTKPAPGGTQPTTTQTVGVGSSGVSYTGGTTTNTGGTTTDHGTTYTVGGSGVGTSTTTTTTTGDNTTTNTGGVSINPGNGAVTVNGGTTTNGTGASGSLTLGPGSVSGSGTITAGPVSVGATFGVTHQDAVSTVVTGEQGSQVADVLGTGNYAATTRSDTQQLGGSLNVKALSLSADTTSSSSMQVFQQLPTNWSTMSQVDRDAWSANTNAQQKAALGGINALGDVQLEQMQDGTGIHAKTGNGWNGSVGINYGAVSTSLGGGVTSASEVTLAKQNGKFEVSVQREDGVSWSMGAGIAGFGLKSTDTNTNDHAVKFQVDPSNTDAMNALKGFMQTGLLPGADRLTDDDGKAASTRFNSAKASVDQLNAQIQPLQAKMAQTGQPPDPQLAQLYSQLDAAQQALSVNRNYLNDRWQGQYGTALNGSPMAGLQVEALTDTRTNTFAGGFTTPVGDVGGASETRTWVHRQYYGTTGTPQDQYSFDDQYMGMQQHVNADTDPNHVVLSMFTNTSINDTTAGTLKSLQNSNMPGYVADAIANHQIGDVDTHGQVNVALTAPQLNMITASLNDMNNPKSQAMWADFAVRSAQFMAGQDFTLKTGDTLRDQTTAVGGEITRHDWYIDLWARDPNDPLRKGLASFGTSPYDSAGAEAAAAAKFSTIRTPADFQKLSAAQQQLFISVIEQTSGPVYDLTGNRNSYEALAACALLHDEAAPAGDAALRAQSMSHLFEKSNEQGKNMNTDAVFEFVKFTDRFKEDPARNAVIQQGMSFDWKQAAIDNAVATQSEAQITQSIADNYHSKDNLMAGFDFGGGGKRAMVDMMEAANKQGGAGEVQRVMTATGISAADMLARVGDDPARQHMVADILQEAGYNLAGIPLAYACTP